MCPFTGAFLYLLSGLKVITKISGGENRRVKDSPITRSCKIDSAVQCSAGRQVGGRAGEDPDEDRSVQYVFQYVYMTGEQCHVGSLL